MAAFPGAQGFGAGSVGGRGGRVIAVTNLNDSGPGSFRAAVTASGPRIVVFEIGGTINLLSRLEISNPFITIAAQTAPGGGIALKADQSYKRDALNIGTHDVVIRGLRVRPDNPSTISSARAAINIRKGSHDVVLDHISASWGIDNVLEILDGSHDVTIQWSIISEGLSHSTHTEGEHSRGLNISSKTYNCPGCRNGNLSIHHNLIAHNNKRNPEADAYGVIDFVNNVLYDYGERASAFGDLNGTTTPVNLVGNFYKAGPSSSGTYEIKEGGTSAPGPSLWVRGNVGPHLPNDTLAENLVVDPAGRNAVVGSRFPAPAVSTTTAATAYDDVLASAGAIKPSRDAVDARVVGDVANGTGSIIDDPSEVGGWPSLAPGTPPTDTDQDGMPDSYEDTYGLDPVINDSAEDINGDGYTNVEEYINGLFGSTCGQ